MADWREGKSSSVLAATGPGREDHRVVGASGKGGGIRWHDLGNSLIRAESSRWPRSGLPD